MRIVVLSDIHGNRTALETVARTLPQADRVIVAGDLCLDGPDPAGALDMLADLRWELIVGNTDLEIVDPRGDAKREKADIIRWTREQLGPERIDLLRALPFSIRINEGSASALVVHANPLNLEDQLYPTLTEEELEPYIRSADAPLLAFGHLHIPYTRPVGGTLLVDVSSVGHPKDRDRRSAYTVIEWNGDWRAVTQVRVPYDIDAAVAELERCGMPHAGKQATSLLKASY